MLINLSQSIKYKYINNKYINISYTRKAIKWRKQKRYWIEKIIDYLKKKHTKFYRPN